MKSAFLFILSFLIVSSEMFGQNGKHNVDRATGKVSNLNARYDFGLVANYDYDLQASEAGIPVHAIVIIKINEYGTGQLITFLKNKNIFDIVECIKTNNSFQFTLLNIKGRTVTAKLIMENNSITSFMLDNANNNTAIVFFN